MTTAVSSHDASPRIGARIDRIPMFTPRLRRLMALLIALFLFDIIDLAAFGLVAPSIKEEFGLSVEQLGLLASTVFVGMVFGGLIGGNLADRLGRRPVALVAVALFSLASFVSAFAPGPELMGLFRIITGVGLTATTGVIIVLVNEYFPRAIRGRAMAWVFGVACFGGPLIALVARIVVPAGDWRAVFMVGALGVFVALAGIWLLPESPRWLALKGRESEATAIVETIEADYTRHTGLALPPVGAVEILPSPAKVSVVEILKPRLLARTIIATLMFGLLVLLNYGFGTWLPTILVLRGYPQDQTLTFAFLLSFAGVAGALTSGFFIDRIERKWLISVCAILMGVCYLLVGFVDAIPVLLGAGAVAYLGGAVLNTVIFTYMPEIFPTEVRGAGAGFANGVGRLAGVASAVIIGFVLAAFSTEGVFVYLAAVTVVIAVLAVFGPVVGVRAARQARILAHQDGPAKVRETIDAK